MLVDGGRGNMASNAVRCTALRMTWMLVLIIGAAGSGILPNCTISGTTLPTADTTVNMSCTSVAFSNVVVTGNMTLNISISGIVAANPGSPNITVTISSMTLQGGATLAIDSRGYVGSGGEVTVSIMMQSLMGRDGCLVFLGSFTRMTSILISGAQMMSSTDAALMLPALDPHDPSWHKMVAFVLLSTYPFLATPP